MFHSLGFKVEEIFQRLDLDQKKIQFFLDEFRELSRI